MPIAELAESILASLPIILVAETVVAVIVWYVAAGRGDRRAQVAAWVGLVTLTLWLGSLAAFVVLHVIMFVAGREAAFVGIVITTILMLAMPFGWAYVIRHRRRNEDGGGRA